MTSYAAQSPNFTDAAIESRALGMGSGVSWGAILAGAVAAASLSLILVLLGVGLGFTSVSPWAHEGASARAIGIASILWLTLTQLAASGMGGYIAGRLRTRWQGVHGDEVYFRDTAHGFLAWGVATLVTAATLTGAIGSVAGTAAQSGAALAGGAATAAAAAGSGAAAASASAPSEGASGPMGYFVDALFRKDAAAVNTPSPDTASPAAGMSPPSDRAGNAASVGEVGRIFANSLRTDALPPDDAKYVAQLVAQRTGLSQQDAEKRVNDIYAKAQATRKEAETKAREAADQARKTSAYATLWLFISLLIGAFVASFAATHGGRRRDL
ncbi:hypothetical protein QTI33_27530 [Variovorax sp. J22P271]|uniref:hypothetical protein n=1 Tax=Variovorax davisae TaxID=3053515 RepID=UPI002578E670|nr:hypothetical protein [Variovorax sp. J22P271]MDM0035915.1 hypothetical protein [Variovorax sp. J22P271]